MEESFQEQTFRIALTFDDITLVPGLSEVHPNQVELRTRLTRGIELNVPIVSAAMDTVTEARLAIAMAQQGGIGIVHKNLAIDVQADEVDKVKRSESGMIVDPVTIRPDARIREALDLMARYKISGVPVTSADGHLVGILTNRDLRFEENLERRVEELMTHDPLVTVPEGTTLEQAKTVLHKHRIEKLLVVDAGGNLKGLITVKDIQKQLDYPFACKDDLGRLRVGAAVGASGDYLARAEGLLGFVRVGSTPCHQACRDRRVRRPNAVTSSSPSAAPSAAVCSGASKRKLITRVETPRPASSSAASATAAELEPKLSRATGPSPSTRAQSGPNSKAVNLCARFSSCRW